MVTNCDFCGTHSYDLKWDGLHAAMQNALVAAELPEWARQGPSFPGQVDLFLCETCVVINNKFWEFSALKIRFKLEMSVNKRAFRRIREALSVQN